MAIRWCRVDGASVGGGSSSADPTRTTVAYVDEAAGNIEIPEKLLNTGSLGGLLTFRSQDLDQTRNTLGQLALAFADAFNAQHTKGYDADGNKGKDFFSIGSPVVYSNSNNADKTVSLTAKVVDSTKVQATDYKIVLTVQTGRLLALRITPPSRRQRC